jgi:hypothetical protein
VKSQTQSNLQSLILSFPSLLQLGGQDTGPQDAPRSWIQLAKTGTFQSKRYGKFSITRNDLAQMLHNFTAITPKAPTELPVDWDHLSMSPQRPGDGAAAGWMKKLELRQDGDELWAEIEWTPAGASAIKNGEYRFVSPSFVKEHTHKDGEQIGTTLLAAAITNHPFLEGMKALTLYSLSAMGDLAIESTEASSGRESHQPAVHHLAELGQRVSFAPDAERTPELTADERAQTFVVKTSVGEGDDQFVRLMRVDGTEFGWFRNTQLAPAPARKVPADAGPPTSDPQIQEHLMSDMIEAAARFEAAVKRHEGTGLSARDAFDLAQMQDRAGAEAYRLAGVNADVAAAEPAPVLSLSGGIGETESFHSIAQRYAEEYKVQLRDAIRIVGAARPDLAAAR